MAKNEYKGKGSGELTKAIADMREKLRVIRFGGAGSRSRNVKESRGIRKDIARALTEVKAQHIAAEVKKA